MYSPKYKKNITVTKKKTLGVVKGCKIMLKIFYKLLSGLSKKKKAEVILIMNI